MKQFTLQAELWRYEAGGGDAGTGGGGAEALAMSSRSILVAGLAVLALVACGQREEVRLAAGAGGTTDSNTSAPAEQSEPSGTPPPQSPDPAPPTAQPSPEATEPAPAPVETAAETAPADTPRTEPTETADPGAALWNRSFAATSIEVAGQPRPIVDGTQLYVMPFRTRDEHGIRFHTGCNTGGAALKITAERFLVGEDGGMTSAGCSGAADEQQGWFLDFIRSNPRWQVSADAAHLRLTSGNSVVTFVEQAWAPWTTTP